MYYIKIYALVENIKLVLFVLSKIIENKNRKNNNTRIKDYRITKLNSPSQN